MHINARPRQVLRDSNGGEEELRNTNTALQPPRCARCTVPLRRRPVPSPYLVRDRKETRPPSNYFEDIGGVLVSSQEEKAETSLSLKRNRVSEEERPHRRSSRADTCGVDNEWCWWGS